jgi:VanZ family protein
VKFTRYWLPVIIYASIIFYLSSIPGEDIPGLFPYQEVVFHIVEYSILALLLSRAFKAYNHPLGYSRRLLWVVFLTILYAVSDEFHQSFVPNRHPSLIDLTYDSVGAFIANIFYR